jgi:asparagine synthase (glutamine-hydrolysing)
MAGIAGWIAPARGAADEAALGPMLGALARRGIGSLVAYTERNAKHQVVLGASHVDAQSRIALVLDGALANAGELRKQLAARGFRFDGDSPEEVLLRAYQYWDKDLVKHLVGAFALALWDARKDRLLLARDRFGEKPLFLHEKNGALSFASEAKSLLAAIPAKVDLAAVYDCLAHRYAPGPRTLFAGIRKLAPGTCELWQMGRRHEVRYWVPPDAHARAGTRKGAGDGVAGFVEGLESAVKLHAAQGVLLSGGLDSAMLVALACRSGAPPKTFSLGFEGDRASELPQAARVAKHFGTAHHEIVVSPHELAAHLEFLVACRDAPASRPSDLALCRLFSEAARSASTVLTGDGCDEVLGGYRRYVAEVVGGGVDAFPARLLAPLVSAGRFDTAAAPLRLNGWPRALFPGNAGENGARSGLDPRASPLRRALYLDQTTWLPDQLLERNDRVATAAGLDARLPFLDHRLVEHVSALPDEQRVRGFTTKWILRQAARALLPAPLHGRKGGWRLDVAGWLRNELRDFMLEHLRGGSSVTRAYYDAPALDRALDEHLKGKKNHETLLWTLLNIEIWHRTYRPA